MRWAQKGFTTIDCLVAMVVFTIGVLGATTTAALAIRLAHEGSQMARAGRLVADESARITADIAGAAGACSGATPGARFGQSGIQLTSTLRPAAGGQQLEMVVTYPTVRGQHVDSAAGFVRCH